MKKIILAAFIFSILVGCGKSGIDACVDEIEIAAMPAKASTNASHACSNLSSVDAQKAARIVKERNPTFIVSIVQDAPNSKPSFVVKIQQPVTYGPGLGMSYPELMRDFGEYIPVMNDAPLASGEQRKMGQSDKAKALGILEVVGDLPTSVDRTTLTLMFASDSPVHTVGNTALLMLFSRNVFPDWPEATNKMLEGVKKLSSRKPKPGENNAAQLLHGDKRVVLKMVKEMGMLFVTVQHQSAPVD